MGRIGKAVFMLGFFLLLSFPKGAGAQVRGGQCASDIQKFCKDVPRGQGRIAQCLKSHQAELSDGCRQAIGEKRGRSSQGKEACSEDLARFCKDVKPGEGRMVRCLRSHLQDLSTGCRAMVSEGPKHR